MGMVRIYTRDYISIMKHDWSYKNPAPFTKWFKYFGCHNLRQCKNCGIIQEQHPETEWMRVIGYKWHPLAGRCKGKTE
jgi:hypothetical protein